MTSPSSPDFFVGSESSSVLPGPRFIEAIKTVIIQSLKQTFDQSFPETAFQNMYISMEYPLVQTQYPGVWVRFSFKKLQIVGVASYFIDSQNRQYKQWFFEGVTTLQVFAMTSLERDRMSDALIYMFSFGDLDDPESRFLKNIYANPYISVSLNTDELNPGGQSENIGAPWQEDQIVYNDSYSFQMVGQFASDVQTAQLVTLDQIEVVPTLDIETIRGYQQGGY